MMAYLKVFLRVYQNHGKIKRTCGGYVKIIAYLWEVKNVRKVEIWIDSRGINIGHLSEPHDQYVINTLSTQCILSS